MHFKAQIIQNIYVEEPVAFQSNLYPLPQCFFQFSFLLSQQQKHKHHGRHQEEDASDEA